MTTRTVTITVTPTSEQTFGGNLVTVEWVLYESQALAIFGTRTTATALDLTIDERGFVFAFAADQAAGHCIYRPENFEHVFGNSGQSIASINEALQNLQRRRGQRGPSVAGQKMRDELLAQTLVLIAVGMSRRKAVRKALDDCTTAYVDPLDEGALLKLIDRHLRRNRLSVPI
jgi:hypothetical protein